MKERRQQTHEQGDRRTKQMIVLTVCACGIVLVSTMCYLGVRGIGVPDPIDRLATLIVGGLLGWLGKTAADAIKDDGPKEPIEVTADPNSPLPVTETEPIKDSP